MYLARSPRGSHDSRKLRDLLLGAVLSTGAQVPLHGLAVSRGCTRSELTTRFRPESRCRSFRIESKCWSDELARSVVVNSFSIVTVVNQELDGTLCYISPACNKGSRKESPACFAASLESASWLSFALCSVIASCNGTAGLVVASEKRYKMRPLIMTASATTSEACIGCAPGIKGKANATFPIGTMRVIARNKSELDPYLRTSIMKKV